MVGLGRRPCPTLPGGGEYRSSFSCSSPSSSRSRRAIMSRVLLRKSKPGNARVRGELVRRLQRSLTDKNFSVGLIDGIFGGDTEKAVKAWQKSQGEAEDGIVTFDFWTGITGTP